MKRYESYKDSGVKWLGEIPGHWEVYKLKYLFRLNKIKNVGNKCNTILSLSYGKIIIKKDLNEGLTPESYESYQLLNKGDIVIRSTDLQNDHTSLRTGLVKSDGAITSAYIGLKNLNVNLYDSRYYHYFLHDWDITKAIYNEGKGLRQSLNWDDIKNMLLPVLDINEQTAIANYLDSVTSKIDEAISQQQKMIDLLNERKQIIIQNAVTKGLDPNAKMKDSGVEWIGEIPEDWEVRPIKTLLKLKKKLVGSKSNKYNLLSLSIDGIKIRDLNNPMGKFPTSFDTYQEVNKNDFVFCNFDNEETPRAVGLSKVHGMITGAYDVMVLYDLRVDIEYLYLVFLDIDNFKKFKPLYKGLRKTVPYDSFMSYKIAIPPFEEQREISESLLVFLKNIDSSISQCNKMISLLQERKQIIINDVVTGKVKVI